MVGARLGLHLAARFGGRRGLAAQVVLSENPPRPTRLSRFPRLVCVNPVREVIP